MAKPRRRMMLVTLTPKKRMPRVYATLNPDDKSGLVALSGGNRTATGSGGAWGVARATIPIAGGQHYWETTYTFTSGDVAAGIATLAHSLTVRLGSVSGATTGPDKLGDFYRDGIKILDLSSLTSGVLIRHWLDADAAIYRISIGTGSWIEVSASASDTYQIWYPAIAVLNGVCVCNFGESAFSGVVPPGVRPGVFDDPLDTVTLRISSHKFGTGPSDDPPNTPYQARITSKGSDVWIEREGSCWVQGNQTRSSRGELTIIVADGKRDDWSTLLWRDSKVVIQRGYEGDRIDQFTHWTTALVETHKFDNRRLVLTLTDQLARLDRAIRTDLYPNTQPNEQLVHRAKPLCMGSPFYCEGALLSTSEFGGLAFAYDLHGDVIFGINEVYDRGDVFVEGVDWNYLPGRTGFKLDEKPDGKVVVNPIGALLKVEAYIDASNGGAFTNWSAGGVDPDPDGWAVQFEGTGRIVSEGGTAGTCVLTSSGGRNAWMQHQATTLAAGELHVCTITVLSVVGTGIFVAEEGTLGVNITAPGTYRLIIEGVSSGYFEIRGDDSGNGTVTIDNVEVYKAVVVEYLPEWFRYLCIQRGEMDEGEVNWDSIDELNAKTKEPCKLAYFSNTGSETFQQLLRMTLDGWCGGVYTNRAGLLSVGRVEAPSTPVLTLNRYKLKGPPLRELDLAPGLTTLLAGGRNYSPLSDSDIVFSASMALRTRLKAEWTIVRSGLPATIRKQGESDTKRVSSQVVQADGNEPKGTLLQEENAVQSEISRVNSIWREPAYLWTVDAVLQGSQADDLEPYQTVRLQYPRQGLDLGRNMLVMRVRSGFWTNSVSLTLFDPKVT